MKKKSNKRKSIGLPGGPNEFINYAPQLFSTEGYKTNSPDVNNPYNIIPSGDITMKDVDFPVMGTDNLGNQQLMQPGFDYKFPGDIVFEEPRQYKKGGEQNTINKYGRSLPKFQSKGQVNEPLFGTQEQIDSYEDSLNLHNSSDLFLKRSHEHNENPTRANLIEMWKAHPRNMYPTSGNKEIAIKSVIKKEPDREETSWVWRPSRPDHLETWKDMMRGYDYKIDYPVYKKPVQPYILDTREKLKIEKLPIKTSLLPVADLPTEIIYPTREYTPPPPPPSKLEQMQNWMKNIDLGDWAINSQNSDGSAGTSFNPDLYNHYRNQRKAFSKDNPLDFINPAVIGAYPTDKDGRRGRFLGLFDEGGSLPKAQTGYGDIIQYNQQLNEGVNYDPVKSSPNVLAPVSHALDVVSVPGSLMAEAVEGIGGYGDQEFNFGDVMPGFSGDFSFTNMYGNPQKWVSDILPGTKDAHWTKKLIVDMATDPTTYIGAGIFKNLVKKGLSKGANLKNVVRAGIDKNFLTRPLTPLTKNELTSGKQLYRKIGSTKGLQDLIDKGGAQAPNPFRMKSGVTVDTPFFGIGKKPNENYGGLFAVETPLPSKSKYNWSTQVGGTSNFGVAPFDKATNSPIKNIPLDDLEVFRKKWFSNNYKKLDKQNLQKELESASLQDLSEKLYKWGIRGYAADQILNDGDLTGGKAVEIIEEYYNNINKKQEGGSLPKAQYGFENKYALPVRNGVRLNYDEEGNVNGESTHIMRTETLDGKNWFSFPSLFQNEDGTWVDMSTSSEKDWMPVYEEAKKRGEVIEFGTDRESAIKFGEGSWKPKAQEGEETKNQLMFDQDFYNNQRSDRTGNNSSYELENKKLKNKHQEEEAVFTDINKVLRWQRQGLYAPDETFIDPQSGREVPANIGSMSSWDFEDKYGTSLHAMRNTYDKAYVDYMSSPERQKAISKFGTIKSQRQSNLDNMGNNPNSQWIVGASNQQYGTPEQKANTAAFHNNVIGAVVPIPGLEALKLTNALKLPGLIDDAVLPAISKVFKGQGTLKSNVTSYYHGSPWRWEDDLFDASMIGKGEGATKRMQGLNLFPEEKLHVAPKFANINSADAPLHIGSSNKIEQSLLDELNPTIYKFDDIGNNLKLKEVSGIQIKNLKQKDLIKEGFDGIRTQGQITVFPSSVNKLTKSSAQSIEEFVKANPNVKNWVKWTTNPKEFERITGLKLTAKELEELKEATKQLPGSGNVDEIMSLKAPKGNMYGQNQVLTQQQRLLNPDIKNKFFEHQAPVSGPKENKFQKMFKDYNNRITPENYDDFVKNIHGSTDYNLAKTTGKQPHNLGIGNYGKPGMVYSDAPLNNLGKDIINAHEKNHGMFAGTLSKEMSDDLLKPFGTNKPIPHYALKHQADEVFARMGQFKNAVGIGDNQTFTLGHLNLIRKNYAESFLDNGITEMLKKIKPGSAGEKEFLTNMNKYAFGLAPAAIIGAASQMGPKQEDGQFKYGGDLLKAQEGKETNGVKYGSSEYADAYYNLGDGKGGNLLYPSGDPTVAGMKYLPEVKINTFSDGINYPYFDYLTKEEKSLFRNEGPIGSSLRAKALYGYGINGNQTYMDSVDDFVLTASGIPQTLTALQIPQSLLTESLAMAKGEDYNMSDAFGGFTGGKQRYPSDVIGFEDKPGWDIGGSANTVMDILVDPTNWLGVGLLNKFSKANKLKKLDNVGNINLSTYEPTLEAMANRLDEMNDAFNKSLKNSGSKAEKDAAAEIWAEKYLDEIIAMRKLTDKMPKSKLSSEIREKLKDIDIGDGGSQIKKTDLEVHINSKTGEIEQFHSLNKGKVTQQDLDENLPWYLSRVKYKSYWGGPGSHDDSYAIFKRSKKLPSDSDGFIDMDATDDIVQSWGPWKNQKGGETSEGRSLPKAQLGNYIPSWANPKNWGVTNRDNDGTFKQAFDNSVVAGEEEFMWNDKRYATKTDILDSKDSDRVEDYNLNIYDNLSDIEKARREDIFSAINTVLEHESDKENTANLKRLLTLTAVMENTLGVDETAYSRDYTRGPMSIDDIAYKDLFEFLPKMKNYTKSQLKHFKWLENLGYDYKDMDKILSSDDPIAGIAAARMMYARSPDPIPDAKNSRELFDYWVKHYNRGGIEKHGGAEKHFKKWNQFYKDLYTYDKGGEINELEMYRNYVEGVYNNTKIEKKAEKLYDKYNRIYYKDAKALNMSPANYILTHKMDKA